MDTFGGPWRSSWGGTTISVCTRDGCHAVQGLLGGLSNVFGFPEHIQSDSGIAFAARSTAAVGSSWNIRWIFHAPYHPQAAGAIDA